MPTTILDVAIHDLVREEGLFRVAEGRGDLDVTPTIQRLIDSLNDLYNRRASKSHGRFSVDEENYPTQRNLREFVEERLTFADLTLRMMATLEVQARRRAAATGGHVFFARFERDGSTYLLVSIVNDKLGARLLRDFVVSDVQHLDVEGFRFAGRINVSNWQAHGDRYIGFLRGKGDVSEYFKEFLGCDTTIQDRKDTADLVQALHAFAEGSGMATDQRNEFLARAKTICERHARDRVELDFTAFANELMPHDPDALTTALADPERALSDGFVPDRRPLGSLVKFKAETPEWSIEFDRSALSRGSIRYDAEANSLTINHVPEELAAKLRAEENA